ncbi:NAD(P)-dependent oxidoreductase [Pseudonocardia humida]|uniref:NAD(P)H-binding protein n=1 Tax=Pseudonocardia humida TaxID=2800819 RepID=A0ABT1A274_9PSEU|nr:NAD(P)H-binding protein [Pseudonocardia humida]MCO1657020.1 NAD(P)H-binding protein [Pseudonocardia humida]
MNEIIVFGAGGRAGRAVLDEARRRGHGVTAVVRDPARHPDLPGRVAAADVTDADAVARLAAGHDAAVCAAADLTADPAVFFPAAARALVAGLTRSGVRRLVHVGLAPVLPTPHGPLLMDTPGYPQEYRAFYLGHAAGADVLAAADPAPDWLVLSPSGDFDHGGARTGRYATAAADAAARVSYPDFAIAVLDEIERPRHHRTHVGIATGPEA